MAALLAQRSAGWSGHLRAVLKADQTDMKSVVLWAAQTVARRVGQLGSKRADNWAERMGQQLVGHSVAGSADMTVVRWVGSLVALLVASWVVMMV